jgi:hypothetical protein
MARRISQTTKPQPTTKHQNPAKPVIRRFKRGHLWALLKGPFWVKKMAC